MISFSKKLVKKTFNLVGLDIVMLSKSPRNSLLGLRHIPFKTIIDVGANEGQFSKEILKYFPAANVYCFEPLPGPFDKLRRWAQGLNGTVKPYNVALGDNTGSVEMLVHLEHDTSSSILRTTEVSKRLYPFTEKQAPLTVGLTTLDEIFRGLSDPPEPEILVKLDVQGYENRVIKGGIKTFRRARACILEVSLDRLYEGQADFKDLVAIFYDMGFHYAGNLEQIYARNGHVIFIDAVFVK